jgi:hypothetical protein
LVVGAWGEKGNRKLQNCMIPVTYHTTNEQAVRARSSIVLYAPRGMKIRLIFSARTLSRAIAAAQALAGHRLTKISQVKNCFQNIFFDPMRKTVLPDAKNEKKHAVNRQVYDGHKEMGSCQGARAQRKLPESLPLFPFA